MRTLRAPTDELPAGVQYEILHDRFGVRRCRWIDADGLPRMARVDGRGSLARLTFAGPIYDAHLAAMGVNPETMVPCGFCGGGIAAALTVCPECGRDPDGGCDCEDCDPDGEGKPSGYINYTSRAGYGREELCFACGGSKRVDAPHAGEREAALAKARAWKRAQSDEANPVPAGIGGGA